MQLLIATFSWGAAAAKMSGEGLALFTSSPVTTGVRDGFSRLLSNRECRSLVFATIFVNNSSRPFNHLINNLFEAL